MHTPGRHMTRHRLAVDDSSHDSAQPSVMPCILTLRVYKFYMLQGNAGDRIDLGSAYMSSCCRSRPQRLHVQLPAEYCPHLPCASLKMFFLRSTIWNVPLPTSLAMSPVWKKPSASVQKQTHMSTCTLGVRPRAFA